MACLLQTLCVFTLCLSLVFCGPLGIQFHKHTAIYGEGRGADTRDSSGPGEPLFLTPYIEKGQIDQGTESSYQVGNGDLQYWTP